jgi:hypothetical protein
MPIICGGIISRGIEIMEQIINPQRFIFTEHLERDF